jgi:hypothetical protein
MVPVKSSRCYFANMTQGEMVGSQMSKICCTQPGSVLFIPADRTTTKLRLGGASVCMTGEKKYGGMVQSYPTATNTSARNDRLRCACCFGLVCGAA